jgi:hypothetical protein
MTHALKTWPVFYDMIISDKKKWELRKNDREFKEGDRLLLQEYDNDVKKYTGRESTYEAGFIMHGPQFGIKKGYCIISLVDIIPYN